MADLGVLIEQVLDMHVAVDGMCNECTHQWPCPEYRIASDWQRQRSDLIRAWKNRTGAELAAVSKFICAGCSTKDTGMLCVKCIDETMKGLAEDEG